MPDIAGVRFKPCGKIYDFEADEFDLKIGDKVVIESEFGLCIGTVAEEKHFVENPEHNYKKVHRPATEEDFQQREENRKVETDARIYCIERIMARGLPMKFVGVESTLDRRRIIFYFTAEGRIDFRELVKDLAARFKTRIEMRQIGIRDEAKIIGGIGICGRNFCCCTFLTSFAPISIRMAKKQDLVLNVGKLSGLCGRLMCCLRYEYDEEEDFHEHDEEILREHEERTSGYRGRPAPEPPASFPEPPAKTRKPTEPDRRSEPADHHNVETQEKKEEPKGQKDPRKIFYRGKRRHFRDEKQK